MSKRKKILLECPDCSAHLFIKRSLFKVSNHPVYEKKARIIINYSKSILTEEKQSKLWLKCQNCTFEQEFKDENELKEEIARKLGGRFRAEQTRSQRREDRLPKIVQPSKMRYNPETNQF